MPPISVLVLVLYSNFGVFRLFTKFCLSLPNDTDSKSKEEIFFNPVQGDRIFLGMGWGVVKKMLSCSFVGKGLMYLYP